jgi:L-2-hydroxyglutarate oxidase
MKSYDYIVIGAGVVGLTVARELALRKAGSILVIEKEPQVGAHASGRNSGVVHAGIYYANDSLKAKFCVQGARQLLAYVEEHRLPVLKCGKVIVANREENVAQLTMLAQRAVSNGVAVEKISLEQLRELEPEARSFDHALWSPNTAVIDSKAVLHQLTHDLRQLGVDLVFDQRVQSLDAARRELRSAQHVWNYGFLLNTAGVYADRMAHQMGVGLNYRILPFKGLYWKASDSFAQKIRCLIYPTPDIRIPFLGVHITRTVDGKVLFGPTAIPAFGRENYSALGGLDALESPQIAWHLMSMLWRDRSGFRDYVRAEVSRYQAKNFYREAKTLVQHLQPEDIGEFYKVGIRAQLMNLSTGLLEMDFVLQPGPHSLHVLNAVSPAFTSAMAFATHLADVALSQ